MEMQLLQEMAGQVVLEFRLLSLDQTSTGVGAINPGPGQGQWFAGGGGGTSGPGNGSRSPGGVGGGGAGGVSPPSPNGVGLSGTQSTGGGGGGASGPNDATRYSGGGGSGIVVVRYQIGTVSSAKATGGAISFYNGKTIHTFTTSGSLVNTSEVTDAEFVLVGGGGGGGYPQGGGGGAGGMVVHTGPFTIPGPATNAVVVGGGGAGLVLYTSKSWNNNNSYIPRHSSYLFCIPWWWIWSCTNRVRTRWIRCWWIT